MRQKQREIFGILHVCSSVITYFIFFLIREKTKKEIKKSTD